MKLAEVHTIYETNARSIPDMALAMVERGKVELLKTFEGDHD